MNNLSEHTPGPWTVDPDGIRADKGTRGNGGYVICNNGRGNGDPGGADARLIAAAPDLLEAAGMVMKWADHSPECAAENPDEPWVNEAVCDCGLAGLRSAIAKAEGRE